MRSPLRLVPFAAFFSTVALLWDSWWHGAIGRDSFFIPPHDLLYAALFLGFVAVVWQMRVDKRWSGRLMVSAITSILIFASAPFDNLWHNIFGKESIASLLILWSPPHLMALLSSVVGGIAIYGELLRRFPEKYFLHLLQAVPVFTFAQFILLPFEPVSLHHIGGFYGQFALSLVSVLFLLTFARVSPFRGTATLVALLYISIFSIGFTDHRVSPEIATLAPSHPHPALWSIFFSLLAGALAIDGLYNKKPALAGFFAALASTLTFYPFARYFLDDLQFFYGTREILIAVISGAIGGAIGGWLMSRVQKWFVTPPNLPAPFGEEKLEMRNGN